MDDRATAHDYSDPMSEKLLGLAADVLRSFGSAFGGRHLAIVGGAVPSLLVGTIRLTRVVEGSALSFRSQEWLPGFA